MIELQVIAFSALLALVIFSVFTYLSVRRIKEYKKNRLRVHTLEKINKLTSTLNAGLDLDRVIVDSIEIFRAHLSVNKCSLILFGKRETGIEKSILIGDNPEVLEISLDSILKTSFSTPQIILIAGSSQVADGDSYKKLQMEVMLIPLIHRDYRLGVIYVWDKPQNGIFSEQDKDFALIFGPRLSAIIANNIEYETLLREFHENSEKLMFRNNFINKGFPAKKTLH